MQRSSSGIMARNGTSGSNKRRLLGIGSSVGAGGTVGPGGSTCETNMWAGSSSCEIPQVVGPPPTDSHGPYGLLRDKCVQWIFLLWKNLRTQILVIRTMMGSKGLPYRKHMYQDTGVALDDLLQGTHYPFPHWPSQSTQDHFSSCCLIYRAHSGARRSWLVSREPL